MAWQTWQLPLGKLSLDKLDDVNTSSGGEEMLDSRHSGLVQL